MERLEGIYCALWTPTDPQGEVLWEDFEKHLSFVLESGVHGIMALGSTGEFLHLTIAERKELMKRIISACKARGRRVIANVSDVQIRNVIDLARHAESLGADCLSVLPPWYFPLEQRDLVEFFLEIGRKCKTPLALYNFPEVTGKRITLKTIELVARATKVIAVKQSGAEFEYHHDILKLSKELGFCVLTGTDTRLEEALGLGCSGTVSGLANAIPEVFCRIFENFRSEKRSPEETEFVSGLAKRIEPLVFPLNVKAAVAARGFETGCAKMPVSAETNEIYEGVVNELTEFFRQIPT